MKKIIANICRGGGKTVSYLLAAFFAFAAAQFAQAADCYWAGGTSSDWGTVANWTTGNKVPDNDGAYFRSDKFNDNFKSGNRAYLVTFAAAHTNNWRTYFNNCGTASAPIVLRGSNAAYGLTSGDSTDAADKNKEGIYIGTNQTGGNGGTTDSRASTGNAYVRFETGTYATGGSCAYFFLGNNSYDGHMTVAGATINPASDFKIYSGSLTIESGTVNVTSWTRLESNSRAKTINLNGGTLHTYRIHKAGGTGAATVNFNGGTLRIKTNYNSVIDSGVTVNVKANGGTIDVNGTTTAAIPASFSEDSSSTGGGMKFCGGGTITLGGSIGYTGGTTIEAGTTVKVATVAQKDALLGSGLNMLKFIPSTTGTHTLITITGDGTFSDSDLLKVAVAPGVAGTAAFSLSNDRKSLVANVSYAGGEINQSTPTLVFPGATLADLDACTLRARFQGSAIADDGVEATFFNRAETRDGDDLAKVTYQLQTIDDVYAKSAKVEFTADASGVYAKLVDDNYSNYGNQNAFGTDLSAYPGKANYIPYAFRLVEPCNSISVNFTRGGANLDTTSSVRYGGGDFAVPYSAWANMPAANGGTMAVGGATFTITKTSGAFGCVDLNSAKDLRHGYLDDSGLTVVVDVTDIPYEFYRIVTYHATDSANLKFGHVTINGIDYTGVTDATTKGSASWGLANANAKNKAKGLREGVNYLVSDVMSGSSVTITGHRDASSPTCRGCIAAIQIVEYVPTTYTATISDGGAKTFSALAWDKTLPACLTSGDQVVVNVNQNTTLTFDSAIDVYGIKFNVAEGKTLTLAGSNIAAQYITATGAGQTVVASASQLAGTVKGDGTLVYGAAPSGVTLTDSVWSGVLWLKNGTMNGLLAQNLASVNSTLRLTGVTGYFNNGDSEMTCAGALELVDDGTTPAFTVSNGFSTNGKTVFAAVKGDGTFKSDTTTAQRYVFKDASAFTGTIDIPSGKNTRVILGNGASLAPANGTITLASGATATVAAGKTWTASGGLVVNGTLMLGAGATAPAVVSGTGTVGVASGTGTINGFAPSAVLTLATEPGATLAIVDAGLTTMTIQEFQNFGTIDLTGTALTEATLNLASGATVATPGTILYPVTFEKFVVSPDDQSVRSLDGYTLVEGLPEGATYYVTLAETREEFGKGSITVSDVASGVNVRVARPDGTFVDVVSVEGTMTLTETPQIAGAATAFDATYTNTVAYAYRAPGWNAGSGQDVKPPVYNNTENDETTGMYILHHPWVSDVQRQMNALGDFTLVVVGTMSPSHNTQFLHIGNSNDSNNGLLIATTDKDDEVLIAKNTGNVVDAANGVRASVPNAATARHAYVINKKGSVFEVWVDGVKRGQFDAGEDFVLGADNKCGVQVGSDHGGTIKNAGIYKGVPNSPETETGIVNLVRLFDYSIVEAQAEAVFNTYPYVSQGGLYTRTVAAGGTFSQTDAWEKEGASGTFAVPEGATVDETYYNPSATIDVNAAAEIEVNADVALETFTVGGTAPVKFVGDGTHTLTVVGAAIVNSPVTIEYGALNISSAPVQLGSSGAIHFDLTGMDTSELYTEGYVQLTGLMDRNDEKVTATLPTDPDRTFEIAYNTSASCYGLNVTPKHNYVVVENRMTAIPALTAEKANIIVGAGGIDIGTLAIPEGATLEFDPIKTPFYVWGTSAGSFTIGEGAKLKLTPNYAGMTLGRIVLMTYRDTAVTLPENLDDLFDAASIAPGATFAVTRETFQNHDGEVKQLVLMVGDYENDAKEIVVMAAGDSITQGVKNSAQGDANPQYRTSIAAYLAANGYKPKFRGIWRYSDRNGANVQVPDDWAYHCGFGCAAIRTTESSGGLADNMPFYLDIAGYPDVITLLIGTNDLGMNGKGAEETFTNYVALVNDTAAQRPNAKIIGATILPRPSAAGEKVVAFNTLLAAEYAKSGKGELPDNFYLLDLHPLVPNDVATSDVTGNYAADNLHPNWKGHAIIAEAFYGKIAELLPLATFAGAGDATVTDAEQTALGAANISDLADYRVGMTHVFTIEKDGAVGATNCFTSAPYTTVENSSALTRSVSKVGYYMELVRKGTSRRRWVWVDMDATGKTLGEVDFPWNNANMQRIATKLHVKSNYAGIHDVAANDDSVSGIVEGTKWNYGTTAALDGAPDDIGDVYGWNDTMATSTSGGHGCFQVHRIFSQTGEDTHWNDAEVLFAWNKWGFDKAGYTDNIGIGPYAFHVEVSNNARSMDYTFTENATAGNCADAVTSDAYSVRRVEIWAVFDGDQRHGVWSGLAANSDFDTTANWEDGRVPNAGDDIDFSAAPGGVTISLTGASAGKKFGTATMGSNVVTFTGDIAFASITDTSKITVGANSTVTLDGNLEFTGSGNQYVVNTVAAGGKFVVTGDVIAKEDFTGYLFHSKTAGNGAVQARGVANNATSNSDAWAFRLGADTGTDTANWIIGDHGLFGSKGLWTNGDRPIALRPLGSDFSITASVGIYGGCEINTTGADGNPYTITVGDGSNGHFERNAAMTVTGTGKVLVNAENTLSGAVTVTNTATLAINAGKTATTGAIVVNDGSMLQVAQSGTNTVNNLTLADGAVLGFNFTQKRSAPVLDVTDKTVNVNGTIKVKVSAAPGARPVFGADGKYTLTSGGKFTGATVGVAEGSAGWVKGVSVDEKGDIVAEIKPMGTMFIIH